MYYQGNALKKRKPRFGLLCWWIYIIFMLAWLIMWCTDVLAHDDSNPAAHFSPGTTNDPCKGKDCDSGDDYIGGHGHIDHYDDENGNGRWDLGEENSWGYWTCDGYKYLVPETDCSEPKPPPPPVPLPRPPAPPPRSSRSSTDVPTLAETLDRIIEEDPEPPIDIEIPEPPPPPPVAELVQWEYQFWKGWNLVSFPVLPEGVETVSDLYHHWAFFTAHNGHIVVNLDGEWTLYSGADGEVTGDIPLSAHLGLAVRLDWATYLGVRGVPLPSAETIDLHAGANLVGFPTFPAHIKRPSDFLSDKICAVIVTRRGEFYLVGRAGDDGDEKLYAGQALILISTTETTLRLAEEVPSAPSAYRVETLITSWGAMKK